MRGIDWLQINSEFKLCEPTIQSLFIIIILFSGSLAERLLFNNN